MNRAARRRLILYGDIVMGYDPESGEDIPECSACRSVNPVGGLKEFRASNPQHPPMLLCQLCSGTMAGNAIEYPQQYPDRYLYFAMCFIGNKLRQDLASHMKPVEPQG